MNISHEYRAEWLRQSTLLPGSRPDNEELPGICSARLAGSIADAGESADDVTMGENMPRLCAREAPRQQTILAYDEAMPSRSWARGDSGRSADHSAHSDLVSLIPWAGTATKRPTSRSSATARALSTAGPLLRRAAAKIVAVEPRSRWERRPPETPRGEP